MRPHTPRARVLRVGSLTPHALRARLSDHGLAIVARLAKDHASRTAVASVATAHARGHDLAIVVVTAPRDRGSAIVAAGASAVVVVDRAGARCALSVSIT